jgi:hypothetical protein
MRALNMTNINVNESNILKNDVLLMKNGEENHEESNAEIIELASLSLTLNNCSFPKNVINNNEKENVDNQSEVIAESVIQKLNNDLLKLTGKSLMIEYKSEYDAWKNLKFRAGKMNGINGKKYDSKFVSFPGFLASVGPKPHKTYSLDRIDPEYGYIEGNVRWASKQLQSENRKFVKEYEVNGTPMSITKIAKHLGISYDALRMALYRGLSIEQAINKYQSKSKVPKKSIQSIQSIIDCPWPHENKANWEEMFKKEARELCPDAPNSRCYYYYKKTIQKLNKFKEMSWDYGYKELPQKLKDLTEYWIHLRNDAKFKLDLEIKERLRKGSLNPDDNVLQMKEWLGL